MTLKLTLKKIRAMFNDSGISENIQNDPKIIKISPLVF